LTSFSDEFTVIFDVSQAFFAVRKLPLRSLAVGAALLTTLGASLGHPTRISTHAELGGRDASEHSVPRGRYHIYARDYPGKEPAFVLMHGFPDNSRLYDRLVPELSGRRVIVFDFLGWGRSDKPQSYPYTFANQAEDLDAVISYFDLQQASLVAHDAAGPAAVNWALDHPDRTASLTLMNAFYSPAPTTRPPGIIALLLLGHVNGPVLGVELTANVAALSEEITRDPATFRRLFTWQEKQFFSRRSDAEHFIPLFHRQFSGKNSSRGPLLSLTGNTITAVAANAGRVTELASFPRPIRLIWGDKDPDLNTGIARSLHDAVPASELFVLPDARHNLQIDEPQRVAELLLTIPPSNA
jgi:haloalkane dehalogenase